ncbi:hypothetical protein SJ05684_b43100 (plasmid) [Sinorhizobium sojae CCBAU 05684]|uniref:Uncharacterized protein n=1 Tax=Sinorhizobium sojae CCBAU 05684 TaxID=716928 RepID=A0A249PHS1_9HYPH|nr:hypothetical protein SJ05684_b43100 [Sinorhizobium sojae CCBAU 05684]
MRRRGFDASLAGLFTQPLVDEVDVEHQSLRRSCFSGSPISNHIP